MMNCLLILLLLLITKTSAAKFESTEGRLANYLLDGYNPQFRPYNKEYGNKTFVDVMMTLSQIISVKEKSQEFTTSVYMQYDWLDDRFGWYPDDYDGITTVRIPCSSIWVPRIVLQNSIDGNFDVSLRTNALIQHDGKVSWLPPALYKSTCTIEVALFPFDWQNCTMVFRSATYDRTEMEFGIPIDTVYIDLSAFQSNGEWDILQRPVKINSNENDKTYQDITFYFIIRRKPQFYIINLIIPCILMSSLSCFVFYLPSISCEKMTLSISILLGETVFLFLIAQRMPETSLAVPLIAGYLLFVMILVIISVICSVVVCNVHYRSNTTHSMPDWIVWIFMEKLAPLLKVERLSEEESGACSARPRRCSSVSTRKAMKQRSEWKPPSEILFDHQASRLGFRARHYLNEYGMTGINVAAPENGSFVPPSFKKLPKGFQPAADSIDYIANQKKEENEMGQSQDDWGYVALILDRLLLWVYLATFTLGTLFFFLQTKFAYYPEKLN